MWAEVSQVLPPSPARLIICVSGRSSSPPATRTALRCRGRRIALMRGNGGPEARDALLQSLDPPSLLVATLHLVHLLRLGLRDGANGGSGAGAAERDHFTTITASVITYIWPEIIYCCVCWLVHAHRRETGGGLASGTLSPVPDDTLFWFAAAVGRALLMPRGVHGGRSPERTWAMSATTSGGFAFHVSVRFQLVRHPAVPDTVFMKPRFHGMATGHPGVADSDGQGLSRRRVSS